MTRPYFMESVSLVLATPATNMAVLLLMYAVFMIAGTALFVRRETNR
jgi:hypothetical protein